MRLQRLDSLNPILYSYLLAMHIAASTRRLCTCMHMPNALIMGVPLHYAQCKSGGRSSIGGIEIDLQAFVTLPTLMEVKCCCKSTCYTYRVDPL